MRDKKVFDPRCGPRKHIGLESPSVGFTDSWRVIFAPCTASVGNVPVPRSSMWAPHTTIPLMLAIDVFRCEGSCFSETNCRSSGEGWIAQRSVQHEPSRDQLYSRFIGIGIGHDRITSSVNVLLDSHDRPAVSCLTSLDRRTLRLVIRPNIAGVALISRQTTEAGVTAS